MADYQSMPEKLSEIKVEVEEEMVTEGKLYFSKVAEQEVNKKELYVDHLIKEEVVIGPEEVQELCSAKSSAITSAGSNIGVTHIGKPQSDVRDEGNKTQYKIEIEIMDHKTVKSRNLKSDCGKAHTITHTSVHRGNVKGKQRHLDQASIINYDTKCTTIFSEPPACLSGFSHEKDNSNFQHKYISDTTLKQHLDVHAHTYSHSKGRRNLTSILIQHLSIETSKKEYNCPYCQYSCSANSTLKLHLRKHTGEKPYSCSFCEYSCSTTSLLKRHVRTHTGEKPYICSYCEYNSCTNSDLKRHLRTHTGEKPYTCTYCEYTCSRKGTLTEHLRTHTGENPYNCHYCMYSCSTKSRLNRHLKTHTGEKPNNCTYCEYSCSSNSDLKRHLRTHTGEKPYSCSYCEYNCSQKGNLIKHLRKTHFKKATLRSILQV